MILSIKSQNFEEEMRLLIILICNIAKVLIIIISLYLPEELKFSTCQTIDAEVDDEGGFGFYGLDRIETRDKLCKLIPRH